MNLKFYNCPDPELITKTKLPEEAEFLSYQPNWDEMEKIAGKYKSYLNLLIVGHGGAINTIHALCEPLKHKLKKKVFYLWTTDPDYIAELKSQLLPGETLVIAISKSGETVTQLEALSQFMEYPLLLITGKSSTLRAIGEKLNADIVSHPPIGGRFTSFTEVALLPALIAGLEVKSFFEAGRSQHQIFEKENLPWKLSSVLYKLEESGYVDVFMPFYSHYLFPASALLIQLCHESFGKAGKGQTYFAHEAPESQHHTNQRFFGGRKNICAIFFSSVFRQPGQVQYPPQIHSVQLKGHSLFDVNKIPLSKSMQFELEGTLEDARINAIPSAHFEAGLIDEAEIGLFTAFWQMYAVYASVLRVVDPFDQPQVENSKKISFQKRLQYKGLL